MSETEVTSEPLAAPDIAELQEIYASQPLSEIRANLSQIVEQVAYSGTPVLIAKHGRPRAAIVPMSTLARARAHFLAAAEQAAGELQGAALERQAEDIDFEDVPELASAAVRLSRTKIDVEAGLDDYSSRQLVRKVLADPVFQEKVGEVIKEMLESSNELERREPAGAGSAVGER